MRTRSKMKDKEQELTKQQRKDLAYKEYEKIKDSALKKYEKIKDSALKKYKKIKDSALKEYLKIQETAWKKYKKIIDPARKKYEKKCEEIDNEVVEPEKIKIIDGHKYKLVEEENQK